MKLFLSSLLILLLPVATFAEPKQLDDLYIYECQKQYSIQLEAVYPDPTNIPECTDDDKTRIMKVVHNVVETDYIKSMLGVSIPEFMVGIEKFVDGAMISPTGIVATNEEIAEHLDGSLMKEVMALNGCGEDDVACQGEDLGEDEEEEEEEEEESVVDLVTAPEEAGHTRGLMLTQDEMKERRRLNLAGCPTSRQCNNKSHWCCTFCTPCNRRRRKLRSECATVRTKGKAKTSKEEKAIIKFQKRVARQILKNLQVLAIEGIKCLGNHWELDAHFERHFFEEIC